MAKNLTPLERDLRQWAIWPPAMAALLAVGLLLWGLRAAGAANGLLAGAAALALTFIWWLLPRLAFKIWPEGDSLCWRWGQLHHGSTYRLALAEISAVDVGNLPDRPTRPTRKLAGVEIHGGNFTPALNRGVKLSTQDGRVIWFGLPQPEKCATALRAALPARTAEPNETP